MLRDKNGRVVLKNKNVDAEALDEALLKCMFVKGSALTESEKNMLRAGYSAWKTGSPEEFCFSPEERDACTDALMGVFIRKGSDTPVRRFDAVEKPVVNNLKDVIKSPKELGLKNDGLGNTESDSGTMKLRWDLMPFDVLDALVDIYTYGAHKYGANNWQNVESERYAGAALRHISLSRQGEKLDQESKKSHLAHACWNIMTLLWKELQIEK